MRFSEARLARLQRVRQLQEEVARAAWLEAESTLRRTSDARMLVADARSDAMRELNHAARGSCNPGMILSGQAMLDSLGDELRRLTERKATHAAQAAALKAPWQERKGEVSALERLRERAAAERRDEIERRDMKALDEIAAARSLAPNRNSSTQTSQSQSRPK